MTAREAILSRRKVRSVTQSVPGLGELNIKRLTAGEDVNLVEQAQKSGKFYGHLRIMTCVTDADGPLYKSVDEVLSEDTGVVDALLKAVAEVNSVSTLEQTAKN